MDVEREIVVNAPVDRVFSYVADVTRHPEWAQEGHRLEVEKTSDGPIGQGSTFRTVGHQFGRNEDSVTITDYAENQRVVYQSEGNAGTLRHGFEVAAADGGTRLTKGLEVVKPKFPFSVLAPIVKAFLAPGNLQKDLERIKAKIEGA